MQTDQPTPCRLCGWPGAEVDDGARVGGRVCRDTDACQMRRQRQHWKAHPETAPEGYFGSEMRRTVSSQW